MTPLKHLILPIALAAPALAAAPPAAQAADFQAILVDGKLDDWDQIAPVHTDPSGDSGGAPVDLGRIYVANDDAFVYLRFEIGALLNLQALPSPIRIHLDTDDSAATGFSVEGIGSDVLVECSRGGSGIDLFEQTASSFYAADLGHAAFDAYQGPTVAAGEFEFRLRRDTALPAHGTVAFPGPAVRLALVALDGGQPADTAPDMPGSLLVDLAAGTPPLPPDNDLTREDDTHVRILTYNTLNGSLFGSQSPRWTRILRAVEPDVIGFQELWDFTPQQVAARLDLDLPLGGGQGWQALKGTRGQITASRFPLTLDAGAPSGELGALVDLPDGEYDLDLYTINSHFKCCGSIGTWEDDARQAAADAIIAWLRELRTPGGAELPAGTPIAHFGDLNLVGGPQPLATLVTGDIVNEGTYGPDSAPDWDGTEAMPASPIHTDGLAFYTWRNDQSTFGPGKLDYVIFSDSAAQPGNTFVLNTLDMSPEKLALLGLEQDDTREASDHLPVVLDLVMGEAATVAEGASPRAPSLTLRALPNPFAGSTALALEVGAPGRVRVAIHDVAGRLVRRLLAGRVPAGVTQLPWDGRDDRGRLVAPGVYVAHADVPGVSGSATVAASKITVLR